MQVRRNIPSRFRPKPYAWHATAVSALFGAQLASDKSVFPRLYKVGPIQPFDHFGNMPTSAILAACSAYGALGIGSQLGVTNFTQNQNGRNVPTRATKITCTALGAGVGLVANAVVETRFGLTQLEKFTDFYKNGMGTNGGQRMDLVAGVAASTIAGRISASTFPSLFRSR